MATDTNYGKPPILNGFRMMDGSFLRTLFGRMFQGGLSRMDAITATAGGTQAAAYQLTKSLNNVSVCATNNDSVALPKAIAGSIVLILNNGAATLSVYGKLNSGDTINGVAGTTAVTQATGTDGWYICITAGAWHLMVAA